MQVRELHGLTVPISALPPVMQLRALSRDVAVLGVCGVAFMVILGAAVALEAERMLVRAVGVE